MEAVHHLLAEPGLQPRPLHLHPSHSRDHRQPVLANWNRQVKSCWPLLLTKVILRIKLFMFPLDLTSGLAFVSMQGRLCKIG
jgi:hypothetical protein